MKTILSHSTDPYFNLAWEEYIFKHILSDEDILLLWRNTPSVIVGRNQIIYSEVNVSYCKEADIPIIRRISGGGTVYHDLGNINFSVITKNYRDVLSNYAYFTKPLVAFLQSLGVNASFSGKSDVVIDGFKISGNAQMYHNNRVLHHGTILFDSDLNSLSKVLKRLSPEIASFGVKSNRTTVTNVRKHLKQDLSTLAFKDLLLEYWLDSPIESALINLTNIDLKQIDELKNAKYHSWSWNYGESPAFNIEKKIGTNTLKVKVDLGLIVSVVLEDESKSVLLNTFKGLPYEVGTFLNTLESLELDLKKILLEFKHELFD